MENLNEKIIEYFTINSFEPSIAAQLASKMLIKKLPKASIILQTGAIPSHICLILKGLARGYYIDEEGNETTKCFAKEMDWCCLYAMVKKEPSPFAIDTLEDETIIACLPIKEIQQLVEHYPQATQISKKLYEKAILQNEKRMVTMQTKTAKEQYATFVKEEPELSKRLELRYIASYLGINPSTLSRLRKK